MRRRQQLLGLALFLLAVGVVKAGQQTYRWYLYADERVEIVRLEEELEGAAVGVVRTQMVGDSLRGRIESLDQELTGARTELDRIESQLVRGAASLALEARYRRELESYNGRVAMRNELFREWREILDENHLEVGLYNLLVDSIRTLATRMGEPYYPIATPAEIAERSGMPARQP